MPGTRRVNSGRGHSYLLDGQKVDGVTTVIGNGIPKPALINWAAGTIASYVGERLDVDTTTGHVSCPDAKLKSAAQDAVDAALENKTTSDITNVVDRLFTQALGHLALFSLRRAGGAYFVFTEHATFVDKIDNFLRQLNGKVNRFPMPKGTKTGDAAVADAVQQAGDRVADELHAQIDGFTVKARKDTLEATADKIKDARQRLKAHVHFLGQKRDELLQKLDDAETKLNNQAQMIAAAHANGQDVRWAAVQKIITTSPQTMTEIMAAAKLSATCYNLLNEKVAAGMLVKTDAGYALPPSNGEATTETDTSPTNQEPEAF
jgi:hypothetical protein